MSNRSNYLRSALQNHWTGKTAFAQPTLYAALCTVLPTSASTGATIVEATYTGYARIAIPAASLNASAAGGAMTNAAIIAWPACTGSTSAVVAVALVDSITIGAGNMLDFMASSLSVVNGVTPQLQIGGLTLQEL